MTSSKSDERDESKRMLAIACRVFGRHELESGGTGHVTVRDPDDPETFWTHRLGTPLSLVSVEDLIRVGEDGSVIEGDGLPNPSACAIVPAIHRRRPDVVGTAHAHGLYSTTISSLARPSIRCLTQDACAFAETAFHAQYRGVVKEASEGRAIAASLGDSHTVVMAHHGALTVGTSIAAAAARFVSFERACAVTLLAGGTHPSREMPREVAVRTSDLVGGEDASEFQFGIEHDLIVSAAPELAPSSSRFRPTQL